MQLQSNKYACKGWRGRIYKEHGTVSEYYLVMDNNVTVGSFVQVDQTTQGCYAATKIGNVNATINKFLLGVVIFDERHIDVGNNSDRIPKGNFANVLLKGSIFVSFTVASKFGQWVHVKTSDGSIVFDDNVTKADHKNTGFRVLQPGAANEVIVISTQLKDL